MCVARSAGVDVRSYCGLRLAGAARDRRDAFGRGWGAPAAVVGSCRSEACCLRLARTVAACRGRRIVAAQDTTEINFDRYASAGCRARADREHRYQRLFHASVVAVEPTTRRCSAWRAHASGRARRSRPDHRSPSPSRRRQVGARSHAAETAATHLALVFCPFVCAADREGDIKNGSIAKKRASIWWFVSAITVYWSGKERRSRRPRGGRSGGQVAPRRLGDKGRTATVAIKAGADDRFTAQWHRP